MKPGVVIPAAELHWQFSKSSGPGGQSVNTTDSRVSLSFDLAATRSLPDFLRERAIQRLGSRVVDGVVTIHADSQRSQHQNRMQAADRLGRLLRTAIAVPPPKRRPTKPSRRANDRRIAGKKQRSETKRLRRSMED